MMTAGRVLDESIRGASGKGAIVHMHFAQPGLIEC